MLRVPALSVALFAWLAAGPAMAQTLRATYEVHAAGMVVMELEARFDLGAEAYRVETRLRTRGLAALLASGEQTTRVAGGFAGAAAQPTGYVSEGVWRGRPRRIALDWQGGTPRVIDLLPPNEDEREPVPEALRSGTVDALSALSALSRQVARDQGCALVAPVFDGRRRSDFTAGGDGWERLPAWRGAWAGDALRCDFEGRQVAGFRRDGEGREAAAPQRGTVWLAAPFAGAPPVPVRVDIPTRWFGTATAVLLRAEPVERRAELGR